MRGRAAQRDPLLAPEFLDLHGHVAQYLVVRNRFNSRTRSLEEIMIGFSTDVETVGRLLLAQTGTWAIDGDVNAELNHKLAESLWWVLVLADKFDLNITDAFGSTMDSIETALQGTIERTAE